MTRLPRGRELAFYQCPPGAPPATLVVLREGGVVQSALSDDPAVPSGSWEPGSDDAAVAWLSVQLVPLKLRRNQTGEELLLVFSVAPGGELRVRYASEPAPHGLSFALRDLDGDGSPELRLGLRRPDGSREIRTLELGDDGRFDELFRGKLRGNLAALQRELCAFLEEEGVSACDPALDVALEEAPLPGGAVLVLATATGALCNRSGCPVAAFRVKNHGAQRLFSDFGALVREAPARPEGSPCVLLSTGRPMRTRRLCWKDQELKPAP